ncbi:HIT-like protein [Gigaspora margarita]|uniref:Protein OS-9 homolog n=1 Tax=Gigaspora margarita TaxID=4874 RepID=A0A8H4ANJ1_GIGMA|nr:HIT-like protein [Gigaspora margarita]
MTCLKIRKQITYIILGAFALLLSEQLARAYSISWVYDDLVAHPQYRIVLSQKQIPNSSLENFVFDEVQSENSIVPSVSKDTSDEGAESKLTSILMRSASGQPYLCQIPFVDNVTAVEEDKLEENRNDVDLMKKGLALLEPMKQTCLIYQHGWWTYEYCHLSRLRQYHIQPGLDERKPLFILGEYASRLATLPPSNKDSDDQKNSLGTDLQTGRGKKYLVQRWGGGSICDLTGKPRQVEIQFHCNLQSGDSIAVVKEMYTCHYLLIVHTPRLCNDPAFLSKSSFKVNPIECRRVVSDEKYERNLAAKEPKSLESSPQEMDSSTKKENEADKVENDVKAEKLAAIANKLASQLKKKPTGLEDSDSTAEGEKDSTSGIKIYFMHEGGRFEEIDSSGLKNDDGNEIKDSEIFEIILETANSMSKNKDNALNEGHGSQSYQAHLNQLYEEDDSETNESDRMYNVEKYSTKTDFKNDSKIKDAKKSSDNNIIKLGFPSLSTTIGQIPIEEAIPIACEVIKEFLNSHKNDLDFQLILIDQDDQILNVFESEWEKFKDGEESRFQMKLGKFTEVIIEFEIGYIVNESTWRLKPDTTPLSKSLYEVIGSKLFEEIKRLYPKPGIMDEAYPVPIPSDNEFWKKGVKQIIYIISPNMNPSRPDPVSLEVAKNALKESYQTMLNAFWALKNGQQYIPKEQQSKDKSAFDVMMNSARNFSSTPKIKTKSSSSTHKWLNVLLPYCEQPEIFSNKIVYYYDDDIVIIWDKYPKAKIHLLVMPRQKIDSIEDLRKQDLNLIEVLKRKGQQIIDHFKENDPNLVFRMGFHAIPSLRQLHMHVISQDFISSTLSTKKHWNSFTTSFFKDIEEIEMLLKEKGQIKFDKDYYGSLLKSPLNCHLCDAKEIKSIPTLKKHLEEHLNSDR